MDAEGESNPTTWRLAKMNLANESKTLAHLRNTLLPGLLPGEVPVRGAERLVEATA